MTSTDAGTTFTVRLPRTVEPGRDHYSDGAGTAGHLNGEASGDNDVQRISRFAFCDEARAARHRDRRKAGFERRALVARKRLEGFDAIEEAERG